MRQRESNVLADLLPTDEGEGLNIAKYNFVVGLKKYVNHSHSTAAMI